MSQILYWNDVAAGVRHATFVTSEGHVLFRGVPVDSIEEFADKFRAFRNSLTDIEKVKNADIEGFLNTIGAVKDANVSKPLTYNWGPSGDEDIDAEGPGDTLHDMSIRKLRALATDLSIVGPETLSKDNLVAEIEKAQASIGQTTTNPPTPAPATNAPATPPAADVPAHETATTEPGTTPEPAAPAQAEETH